MLLLANVYRSVVYMLFLANRPITTAVVFITYAHVVGTLSVPNLILTMLLVDIIGTVSGGYLSVAVQNIVETGVSLRRLKVGAVWVYLAHYTLLCKIFAW